MPLLPGNNPHPGEGSHHDFLKWQGKTPVQLMERKLTFNQAADKSGIVTTPHLFKPHIANRNFNSTAPWIEFFRDFSCSCHPQHSSCPTTKRHTLQFHKWYAIIQYTFPLCIVLTDINLILTNIKSVYPNYCAYWRHTLLPNEKAFPMPHK